MELGGPVVDRILQPQILWFDSSRLGLRAMQLVRGLLVMAWFYLNYIPGDRDTTTFPELHNRVPWRPYPIFSWSVGALHDVLTPCTPLTTCCSPETSCARLSCGDDRGHDCRTQNNPGISSLRTCLRKAPGAPISTCGSSARSSSGASLTLCLRASALLFSRSHDGARGVRRPVVDVFVQNSGLRCAG